MFSLFVNSDTKTMWDDSSDSMSSPDSRKKSGRGSDPKYDFPTSYASKGKSRGRVTKKSSNDDIDQLFGDSTDFSQNSSPDRKGNGGGGDRIIPDYSLPETTTTKTNYLSNFRASSHDFEDSILGELLGGVSLGKPLKERDSVPESPRSTSPLARVDTLEDSTASLPKPSRSLGRHASAPMMSPQEKPAGSARTLAQPAKAQSFRFATELSSAESSPIKPFNKASTTAAPTTAASDEPIERIPEPTLPATKPHHNSFDMDVLLESSGEFIRPSSKPAYMPTLAASRETSEFMKNSNKTDNNPVVPPITTKSLDRGSLPTLDKGDDEEEDAGINFIPSFLDPGRNGRRRRQLDRPSTTGGMDTTSGGGGRNGGSKLDELDAILGLGGASAKSDTGPKVSVLFSLCFSSLLMFDSIAVVPR